MAIDMNDIARDLDGFIVSVLIGRFHRMMMVMAMRMIMLGMIVMRGTMRIGNLSSVMMEARQPSMVRKSRQDAQQKRRCPKAGENVKGWACPLHIPMSYR